MGEGVRGGDQRGRTRGQPDAPQQLHGTWLVRHIVLGTRHESLLLPYHHAILAGGPACTLLTLHHGVVVLCAVFVMQVPVLPSCHATLPTALTCACACRYRMYFNTGAYLAACKAAHPSYYADVPFYPEVTVDFQITEDKATEHYHIPLLLSPYGYSTYRGS